MLKIRLQRVGKKHEPVFRVVVCDSKNGVKSGDNIEILGSYDARDKNETKVNGERVNHWIAQGAQVSDTVHNLLINLGVIKGKKINVLPKKSPIKKENSEQETEKSEEKINEESVEEKLDEAPAEVVEEIKDSTDSTQDTSKDVETPIVEEEKTEK